MSKNVMQLTLLFLKKDNQVLLAMKKRGFGEGKWNGVGGKIEQGETLEQALVRECEEEIRVTPKNYKKMAEINFTEQHNGAEKTMHVHVYTCTEWTGEPTESEEMRPKWYQVDSVPYADMWDDDKYWLEQVLSGKKLRASFKLDDNDKIIAKEVAEIKENFDEK